MAAFEQGTIFFKIKQGPYVPPQDPHVALWAPAEGTADVARFEVWYRTAQAGDMPPLLGQ